jgi:hypothetical protein
VARRFAIIAVLLSASSLFLFRGVIRALEDLGDFATPYVIGALTVRILRGQDCVPASAATA